MLLNTIAALDRDRFEPVFLAEGDGPLVDALGGIGVEIVRGEVRQCPLRKPVQLASRALRYARQLRRWNVDVVHFWYFGWNLDLAIGAWLARRPVVLHNHNPASVTRWNVMRSVADVIFFVSQDLRDSAHGLDLIAGKSRVLHNFIDADHYASGTSIRASLGLSDEHFVVSTVAQVSELKGTDTFIEAARLCLEEDPDFRFLVIGPDAHGDTDFAQSMRDRVEELGLGEQIRFLGSRTDLPDLYATSDLLLHPTRKEAFGLVVAEAMAAGVPVVARHVGGIPEIVTSPAVGSLIREDDVGAFSREVLRYRRMPDRGRAVGSAARACIRATFDERVIVPRLEDTYLELLRSGG